MIEIVFFTSSRIKLSHAKYLCRDYDLRISGFRQKTFRANYVEPRIYDRDKLIEASYCDALERWQKAYPGRDNKFFFIEDTSVIIGALSTEQEVPGLDIKYWMQEANFTSLDAQLKAVGNDRCVTVRSDLILHLPPELLKVDEDKKGYLHFTSSSLGTVVDSERVFDTNPMFPWLDNQTFNKWFVPTGCVDPISMLPISDADKYDFRAPAFREMLAFFEERQIIQRRTACLVQTSFDFDSPLFIICGSSCAGKTTLAEYLAERYGYYHIEASDFMYLSYYQRHGVASPMHIGDFAEQALREQPEIVAEQILRNICQGDERPVIITGFRSPAEVDWFSHHYAGKYTIEVIYVAADENVRYSRSLARRRDGEAENRDVFVRRDVQQAAMGLTEIERCFIFNRLENNGSLEEYFANFEACYIENSRQEFMEKEALGISLPTKLEDLILLALAKMWQGREYFTTTEIAHLINQLTEGKPKSKNNVSRYFNQTYHPYYEVKLVEGKKKYRLSSTGYGKSRIIGGAQKKILPDK